MSTGPDTSEGTTANRSIHLIITMDYDDDQSAVKWATHPSEKIKTRIVYSADTNSRETQTFSNLTKMFWAGISHASHTVTDLNLFAILAPLAIAHGVHSAVAHVFPKRVLDVNQVLRKTLHLDSTSAMNSDGVVGLTVEAYDRVERDLQNCSGTQKLIGRIQWRQNIPE